MSDTVASEAPTETPTSTSETPAVATTDNVASVAPVEAQTENSVDDSKNAQPIVEASEAAFRQVPPLDAHGAGGQIGILLDTMMSITVTLGQVEISIKDLLSLSAGAVLKLDKQVGEPAELYLRGIKFATGHLVVVGEQLGVKIHEIIPSATEGTVAT